MVHLGRKPTVKLGRIFGQSFFMWEQNFTDLLQSVKADPMLIRVNCFEWSSIFLTPQENAWYCQHMWVWLANTQEHLFCLWVTHFPFPHQERVSFLDLGPHLGAELLGRQNVALLIQRGTLQPNTALAEGSWARPETSSCAAYHKGVRWREMSSGLKTTHYEEMHWNGLWSL